MKKDELDSPYMLYMFGFGIMSYEPGVATLITGTALTVDYLSRGMIGYFDSGTEKGHAVEEDIDWIDRELEREARESKDMSEAEIEAEMKRLHSELGMDYEREYEEA